MKRGIAELGAREMDIIELVDGDFNAFQNIFKELMRTIVANWEGGRQKTFIFVYYAGHGIMAGNSTSAVCNGGERTNRIFYPLETRLKALA